MDKILKFLLFLCIASIIIAYTLFTWHHEEMKARGLYKIETLSLPNPIEEESKNWTREDFEAYWDSIEKDRGIAYPKMCPYCYYKYLMRE